MWRPRVKAAVGEETCPEWVGVQVYFWPRVPGGGGGGGGLASLKAQTLPSSEGRAQGFAVRWER